MKTPRRSGGRKRASETTPKRIVNYRQLRHPFTPQTVFSTDEVANLHDTALRVLEELGIKVLLPEARDILQAAGARVEAEMVFIGRLGMPECHRSGARAPAGIAGELPPNPEAATNL